MLKDKCHNFMKKSGQKMSLHIVIPFSPPWGDAICLPEVVL